MTKKMESMVFIVVVIFSRAGSSDFCLTDSFKAECEKGHVILMTFALYGRMNVGRCITRNYGNIGCFSDVLPLLDAKCSGQRSCEVSASDPAIVRTKPCPPDFASYLNASYVCIKAIIPTTFKPQNSPITLEHSNGYIGGPVTWPSVSQSEVKDVTWSSYRLRWLSNYRYKITLIDLDTAGYLTGIGAQNNEEKDEGDHDNDEGDDSDAERSRRKDHDAVLSDKDCPYSVVISEPVRGEKKSSHPSPLFTPSLQQQQHHHHHQQQQQHHYQHHHQDISSIFSRLTGSIQRSLYASLCDRNVRYHYHHLPPEDHHHHHLQGGSHGNANDFRFYTPPPPPPDLNHRYQDLHDGDDDRHHNLHGNEHHNHHQQGNARKRTELLFTSESHEVEIILIIRVRNLKGPLGFMRPPNVLISFEVFGCPEPTWLPVEATWVVSSGHVAITCNQSGITYVIKCLANGSWENNFNNCSNKSALPANISIKEGLGQVSQKYLALSLLITFGIAAVGVLYVGAMILCAVYIKRHKRRNMASAETNADQTTSFLDQRSIEDQYFSPTILPIHHGCTPKLPFDHHHHHRHRNLHSIQLQQQQQRAAEVSYLMKQDASPLPFPRSCFVPHRDIRSSISPSIHQTTTTSSSSSSSSSKRHGCPYRSCKMSAQQQSLPLLHLSPSVYPHVECSLCAEQLQQQQQQQDEASQTTVNNRNNIPTNKKDISQEVKFGSLRGGAAILKQQQQHSTTSETGSRTSSLSCLVKPKQQQQQQQKYKQKYQPIADSEESPSTNDSSLLIRAANRSYPGTCLTNLCERCSDPNHWLVAANKTSPEFQLVKKSSDVTATSFCDRSIENNRNEGNDPDVVKLDCKCQRLNSPTSSNHQRHLILAPDSHPDDGSRRDVINDVISIGGGVQV